MKDPNVIRAIGLIPAFWSYYKIGIPRLMPINYTFSLTNRCNSRCRTCRIWQHPIHDELSTQEWIQVVRSLKENPIWITLSGGEPFLVRDLDEIVKAIFLYNKPKLLVIPTNGLLPNVIEKTLYKILSYVPVNTDITINVSLDGIGKDHDEIRGISGNFEKVKATIKCLKQIKQKFPVLTIGIHTVLSKWNIKKVKSISDYVWKEFCPDHHIFEIAEVRKEMFNAEDSPTPSVEDYREFLEFWFSDEMVSAVRRKLKGISKITDFFRQKYYRYLLEAIFERRRRPLISFAGFASVHIAPNGDVWNCAVYADVMGNLRDYDLDFRKFWRNCSGVKAVQMKVKAGHLCPLANENYVNLLFNLRELIL